MKDSGWVRCGAMGRYLPFPSPGADPRPAACCRVGRISKPLDSDMCKATPPARLTLECPLKIPDTELWTTGRQQGDWIQRARPSAGAACDSQNGLGRDEVAEAEGVEGYRGRFRAVRRHDADLNRLRHLGTNKEHQLSFGDPNRQWSDA